MKKGHLCIFAGSLQEVLESSREFYFVSDVAGRPSESEIFHVAELCHIFHVAVLIQ